MAFMARPIVPKQFRTAAMRGFLLSALNQERANLRTSFQATVATWNHSVNFTIAISYKGNDARLLAWTDDYVWNILNSGTMNRYSILPPGFVPKTRPRVVGSLAGRGTARKSNKSRGSIAAREWNTVIMELHEPVFNQRIAAAIFKGFR